MSNYSEIITAYKKQKSIDLTEIDWSLWLQRQINIQSDYHVPMSLSLLQVIFFFLSLHICSSVQ